MKAMTTEQRQIINEMLKEVGNLLSEERLTHILNAINPAASSNYPHGQIIIKDLNILLTKKNLNKENTMKANEPNEEIIIIDDGFDDQTNNNNNKKEDVTMTTDANTCPKCSGTGKYHTPLKDGSIGKCFACKGTGTKQVNTRPMTEAQIKFIRSLFNQVREFMSEEKANNLIAIMKAHISGEKTQTVTWASEAIDKLKEIQRDNAY